MRKVPLGEQRPNGEAACGFGIDPNLCGQPSTMHVIFLVDNENVIACTKHFNEYLAPRLQQGEADLHSFGGVCTMPGTKWKYSEEGHEGFCFFELPDAVDLSEELVREDA